MVESVGASYPQVSFVVPVYNLGPWLADTLDSLLNQTLKNIEVICVNDGSTDDSMDVLVRYEQKDSRIHVISQDNAGVGHARNTGLAQATGKYVSFIDGDDLLAKEAAEQLYCEAEAERADIVVFGAYSFPHKEQWVYEMFGPEDASVEKNGCDILLEYRGCLPSAANKFYRRSLLQDNQLLFDENHILGEDTAYQFKAFPLAKRVLFDSRRFYGYRFNRPGSAVTEEFKDVREQQEKHVAVFGSIADHWKTNGYMESREARFLESIAFIFYDFESLDTKDRIPLAHKFVEQFDRFFSEEDIKSIYPVERWLYSLMLTLGNPLATSLMIERAQKGFKRRMSAYRAARKVKHLIRRLLKGKREWE